jgi:hypothetical protein
MCMIQLGVKLLRVGFTRFEFKYENLDFDSIDMDTGFR